jgi:general secretion pathway protein G
MIVMGIIFTLAGIMVPSYVRMMDRTRITMAIIDIKTIEKEIAAFESEYDRLPDSLDQINCEGMNDPWNNPYVYMSFAATGEAGKIKVRKDHSLHPLNSSYDLCSMGKDGASVAPLTAEVSRDDIIRANDGGYVGLASEY